ncbi:penicillin-binding protein [Candidatus Daviesbacteria bacterium]|nr:penicillin-binding protein [Candidatus Daviesbacteria bacterium]
MPRGQILNNLNPVKTVLLFVQYILIKIGQAEIWLVKHTVKLPVYALKVVIYLLPIPNLHLLHRSRGRPRKEWFIPYYLNKLKFYYRKRVSKKIKISFALSLIAILVYFYTSFVFIAAYQLPSPEKLISPDRALTTEFYDRNGKLLYRMYEGRNRSLANLNSLPSYFIQATIAAEDRNFYSHPGIDIRAILRAALANFQKRPDNENLEGASTITQQLIKNTLLTPEKTYIRKVKEIILALWAERLYKKDQILQMYVNEAPYGGTAWGVEAAAETYFGVPAKDLTLAQATYLAGLPASPTQFSPYGSNPELGKDRQKEVLRRMVENKFLTQNKANSAYSEDLYLKPAQNNIKAPHFVMFVKDSLSQKYGQRSVSQGGLKIITTIDLNMQEKVEKIVAEEVNKLGPLNVKNGAAMVVEAKTGQILAMVGSKDYHNEEFGAFNVTLSLRQPGSSIKVATYATAFKQGFSPGNTVLDVPVAFRDNWGNSYSPVNYDGSYHGAVSIRQALGSSYNVPAVKVEAIVGVEEVIQTAKDMGVTTFTDPKRYGLALTLGAAEVKMIDMMTLYDTLSQMGNKNISTPILKVTDSDGNVLEEYEPHPIQVVPKEVAYLITSILTDNEARKSAFGLDSLLKIEGKTLAVKTGTSDNKRDNWTFGYTPDFVVGVWVGNNNNSPMNPALASGVTGAAPIWNGIMKLLLAGRSDHPFERPAGIVEANVDGRKDLVIATVIPKSLVRVARKEEKMIFSDPFSTLASPSAQQATLDGIRNY